MKATQFFCIILSIISKFFYKKDFEIFSLLKKFLTFALRIGSICFSSLCIGSQFKCDGSPQCSDQSDETDCQIEDDSCGHKCPEGYCISSDWKCDGTYQCSDQSDEQNCQIEASTPSNDTTETQISSTESSNPLLDTTTNQFLSDKSENLTPDSPIMVEECGK